MSFRAGSESARRRGDGTDSEELTAYPDKCRLAERGLSGCFVSTWSLDVLATGESGQAWLREGKREVVSWILPPGIQAKGDSPLTKPECADQEARLGSKYGLGNPQ